jgi:O-antigen/teichoic acid export membrane protein
LNAIIGAQNGALVGLEAFNSTAKVNTIIGLFTFPLLVGGAWYGGLIGVVIALTIKSIINLALNHLELKKVSKSIGLSYRLMHSLSEISIIYRFSVPAALSAALVGPVNWACAAIIVNQIDGYKELGIYSAANQWFYMYLFLPTLLSSVVLPIISEQFSNVGVQKTSLHLMKMIKITTIINLPLIAIGVLFSPFLMRLYGEGFESGWPTLAITLITAGFVTVNMLIGQMIAASGKMWISLLMNGTWAIIFICLTLIFSNSGSFGLAISRLIAYFFHTIWQWFYFFWVFDKKLKSV